MGNETVRAEWVRDDVYLLRDRNDFPVVMTQPWGVSGADLLPMSLIGCALWDIVAILRKQRQPPAHASARAESERESEPPWRYTRIQIHYYFAGEGLDAARVQRAITLSEEKYCSIFATLREALEITSDFEIGDGAEHGQ